MTEKTKILILCTGNSARSQMAEGLLRNMGGEGLQVESAGVAPSVVRDEAIKVMKEMDIDISGHRSKSVDEFANDEFDYVITVCDNARTTCPTFPGFAKRLHWSFDDPAEVTGTEETRLAAFRRIRDQIAERLEPFVTSIETKTG